MPNVIVTRKNFEIQYRGSSPLTLNLTNAPWLNKILKIYRVSTGSSLAVQSYAGAYNGATPGGAVTVLNPGFCYRIVAAVFDGSLIIPDCVFVDDITYAAAGGNQLPSVSIAALNTVAPTVGTQKQYSVQATDADGSVAKLELVTVASSTSSTVTGILDTITAASGTLSWVPQTATTVYLAARATDNSNATNLSSILTVTVQPAAAGGASGYANWIGGNSIPYGQAGSNPAGQSGTFELRFEEYYAKMIADAGQSDTITSTNRCVPATNTQDVFNKIQAEFPAWYSLNQNCKKVCVFVGESFNIVRGNPQWTTSEEIALLKQISTFVKSFGSNVVFVPWTPPFDYATADPVGDRATINDELETFAVAIRGEFSSGSGSFDEVADVRLNTIVDASDPQWSTDKIHLLDPGQAIYAQVVAWAFRKVILGIPKPAPLLKPADNYAVGGKVLTLALPAGNKLQVSGATIKVAPTGSAGYGNVGSDKYYGVANSSLAAFSKFLSGDQDFVITFSPNANPVSYNYFEYPVWLGVNGTLNTLVNGVPTQIGVISNGTFWGEIRNGSTGIISVFTSPDNSLDSNGLPANRVLIYNFPTAYTGAAYIKADASGFTGQISYLQGLNLTLIPGQSASGEGPYNGLLTFNKKESGIVVDANGNLTGSGGSAYSPSSTIASGTSGGISMKVTDIATTSAFLMLTTPDYYDIAQPYTSVGNRAGIGFRGDKLGVINSGQFSLLSLSLAVGEEYRLYRNKDTSAVTADVKRVGSTTWVSLYTFAYTGGGELVAVAHFNDTNSYIQSPTAIGSTLR